MPIDLKSRFVGSMTRAMAGALHGVEAIPESWLNALENGARGRDYVERLAEQLHSLALGGAFREGKAP